MLSFTDVALRRGSALLFEKFSLTVYRSQKIGLIGANGAGKTSLFRLILGELDADRGDIEFPNNLSIAHLAQEVPATNEVASDYVLSGDSELLRIESELARANEEEAYERIAPLHEALDNIDGYSARSRAERLMAGLGFSQDEVSKPLAAFSGGWRIRLNLARTLMSRADLLLLDEPTNHLDLDAIVWLANWIKDFPGALILISHDREFLDETVQNIALLENQTIDLFSGNYSAFERLKAARLAEQQGQFERQQREIQHMQDFVRRFRAKATKARQAQSRIKALERMELIAPAHVDSPFLINIPAAAKVSDPLIVLDDVTLAYNETVILNKVRFNLHPGDRIGLLGANGAGKSTLMKCLNGELAPRAGSRVAGTHLQIGYFSQHQVDDLDLEASAVLHISRLDGDATEQAIRNFLGGFDFRGDKVYDSVATFSGGQKARLALAMIAYRKPNLLLLDEPTNHLDIEMRQALTVALQDFAGAIVLISHDRHLLMNSVDAFLLVADSRVDYFDGDLDDYRQRVLQKDKPVSPTPKIAAKAEKADNKTRFRENRQLTSQQQTLEKRLTRLQRKLAEVEEKLADVSLYQDNLAADLQGFLRDQMNLKTEIEEVELEWLETSEKLEAYK